MNDICASLYKALDDFNTKSVNVIPSSSTEGSIRYLSADVGGYQFSQKEMLADIDMAVNSVYKSGKHDKQGRRKLYINICRFYLSVANKNTDIDTKHFILTPADADNSNVWAVWFLSRQFKKWVKEQGFANTINELRNDFNKYGSCVSKKVKDDIIRVPLRSIKNDQGAKTILDGIKGDTPFIEERKMSYVEMQEYGSQWRLPGHFSGTRCVYEMYSYIKKDDLLSYENNNTGVVAYKYDDEYCEMVLTMAIIMTEGVTTKGEKYDDKILFLEQIDEIPYNECHDNKQDGRWLGVGEVEKQLENQIARNLSVNLRLKSMQKAATDIYQTQGDVVAKNLITSVEDGEVMQVGLNGIISRVDNSTRAIADYQGNDQVWEDNSQKQSFAFESATGESMGSGTPFRLGALLSNTVMGYFDLKKEVLGIFLQDVFFSKLIPIFQKSSKDDIQVISQTEAGYVAIKDMFVEMYTGQAYADMAMSHDVFDKDEPPTPDVVKMAVEAKLLKSPLLFVKVPKDVYKNAKYSMNMDITGESVSEGDSETMTTLYTAMVQAGDPKASKVLDVILASKGKNLAAIVGGSATAQPEQASQTEVNPNLQGLVTQQ